MVLVGFYSEQNQASCLSSCHYAKLRLPHETGVSLIISLKVQINKKHKNIVYNVDPSV